MLTTVSERFLCPVVIQSELTGDLLGESGVGGGASFCPLLFDNFPLLALVEAMEDDPAVLTVVDER